MNNDERNTYVKEQITKTLLEMMKSEHIDRINVRELCNHAQVGRASFYRNYQTKEDVIREHAASLMKDWEKSFENDPASSFANVFGSLFHHYKANSEFYLILRRNGLSEIILEAIKQKIDLSRELPNQAAYSKAFFAYGLYGWVCEWMDRGMQESADEINQLFVKNNT